jgi:hypothetical protein
MEKSAARIRSRMVSNTGPFGMSEYRADAYVIDDWR